MKEIRPRGGYAFLAPPLDPPMIQILKQLFLVLVFILVKEKLKINAYESLNASRKSYWINIFTDPEPAHAGEAPSSGGSSSVRK